MKPDKPTSKERLEHILKAIEQIQFFSEGHNLESFSNDRRTYSACLYEYTIIGEATVNIDPEILGKYDYPWKRVKAFRILFCMNMKLWMPEWYWIRQERSCPN